jgi:hypothetical protein
MASIITQPQEPVLARKRQKWVLESPNAPAGGNYRLEFVFPQAGNLPDIVLIQVPDDVLRSEFELSEILDALLAHSLPDATLVSDDALAHKTINATLTNRHTFAGVEQVISTVNISFEAIKAGLGHRAQAFDFHTHFGTRFLAFTGNGMKVTKDTEQFLSFVLLQAAIPVKVVVEVTYDDATTANYEQFDIDFAVGTPMKHIPCSYTALEMATKAEVIGKEILSYTVKLEGYGTGAGFITEAFAFTLVNRKARKSFLFANSAGGWSVLHCFGNFEKESAFKMETAEVNVPLDNTADFAQFNNFSAKVRDNFKVSTGYIQKGSDEVRHCNEFLLSRYRYEISAAGEYLPIVLEDTNYMNDKSQLGLIALRFGYSYAFENEVFDEI